MRPRKSKPNGDQLPQLIHAYRVNHGLTYRAFVEHARNLGYRLSVATVWNAENGHSMRIGTQFMFRKIVGSQSDV